MSARPRQGSASFTIVIGALAALITGAIMLTFLFYPIITAMTEAAFWSADTVQGSRVASTTQGVWEFWGAIILLAILSFVWISTRQ